MGQYKGFRDPIKCYLFLYLNLYIYMVMQVAWPVFPNCHFFTLLEPKVQILPRTFFGVRNALVNVMHTSSFTFRYSINMVNTILPAIFHFYQFRNCCSPYFGWGKSSTVYPKSKTYIIVFFLVLCLAYFFIFVLQPVNFPL